VDAGDGLIHGGDQITVTYSIKNFGTATGAGVPYSIHLSSFDVEGGVYDEEIGTGSTSSLVPGESTFGTTSSAVIPVSVQPGTYSLRLVLGSNETFADPNTENNSATSNLTVGEVWKVVEDGGWTGTWTRRGSSNVFDAVWTAPNQPVVTGVMTYTRTANQVDFQRTESSNGNLCHYVGFILEDGVTATGTETCPNTEGFSTWIASIGSQ
jgi:hypothetical protein